MSAIQSSRETIAAHTRVIHVLNPCDHMKLLQYNLHCSPIYNHTNFELHNYMHNTYGMQSFFHIMMNQLLPTMDIAMHAADIKNRHLSAHWLASHTAWESLPVSFLNIGEHKSLKLHFNCDTIFYNIYNVLLDTEGMSAQENKILNCEYNIYEGVINLE